MDAYSWGVFAGGIIAVTLSVWFLGWCFKLVIRRHWFRGHYTQVVITTVLAWLFIFISLANDIPDPDVIAASTSSVVIGGLLALGIRIFANPPPVEDEDGNGDMGLEEFNWKSYYNMLIKINPILSQPGILPASKGGKASDWKHTCCTDKNRNTILKCSKDKWYNGIENGTPFISTKIWDLIYEKMILTDPRSTWETVLFYNKIANDLNSPKLINFFSPVVHHDFRNLNKIKLVDAKRELIVSPDPDDYETKILNLFYMI